MVSSQLQMPYEPSFCGEGVPLDGIYNTLETDEFRLLDLKFLRDDGVLECSVRHAKLHSALAKKLAAIKVQESPYSSSSYTKGRREDSLAEDRSEAILERYTAISYTWEDNGSIWYGDQSATLQPLMVNKRLVYVSSKVANILSLLKQRGRHVIWIDAICINQKDVFEKSDQVVKMGDIFHQAFEVISVLDSPSVWTDCALDLRNWQYPEIAPEVAAQLETGLNTLTEQNYWKRSWVLQEIALAQTSYISCGSRMVLSDVVSLLPRLLSRYRSDGLSVKQMSEGIDPVRSSQESKLQSEPYIGWKYKQEPFLKLLRLSHRFHQCRDPRDFLYSRIALASDSIKVLTSPDYSQPTEWVFVDFAAKCILETGSLEILQFATKTSRKLPSWVPDWTVWAHHYDETTPWRSVDFSDIQWLNKEIHMSNGQQEIRVRGRVLKIILETHPSNDEDDEVSPRIADSICLLRGCPVPVYLRSMHGYHKLIGRTRYWQDQLFEYYLEDELVPWREPAGETGYLLNYPLHVQEYYKERTFRIR